MRMHRKLALGAATLALILSACSSGEGGSPSGEASQPADLPEVSIGSAGFPEAALVAEIYAQALEAQGFTVERHLELGERPAVRAAFDSGDINLAPDYVGGLASLLEAEVSSDADATHDAMVAALEEIGQTALDFSPGTDADGFAVRQETADELSLATMTDLAGVADQLVWGLATGCPDNPVCGPALNDVYGIDISTLDTESLNPCSPEIAEALNNSAIDVAQVCTTQAEIAAFNFVLMEDDGGMAPAQNLVPVLTQDLADAGGDTLADALNAVTELLTTEELTNLNQQIAEQESYEDIASQWLTDNALN
ncbi:MAG TPA: glycine betaine ABC transporter substrate-binding protein [Candidatus Limnocylindria bacterium]|nr:glycine betaine ABC transporter substrate-binding protein [Candidatus Limnocylindria bacterium]